MKRELQRLSTREEMSADPVAFKLGFSHAILKR